jgi:hypothetical protein
MDGIALLHRARHAGLRVEAAGDMLKIIGPKRAEPIVRLLAQRKTEILEALTPNKNGTSYWQERFTARSFEWSNGKRDWNSARRIAWGDLENEWHHFHGRVWPAWQCAGCEKPIGGLDAVNLPDGNRVHLEPIDCLISYGWRWRGDADAALIALGLESPAPDFEGGS